MIEAILFLAVLVCVLGYLLRAAWVAKAREKAAADRLRKTLDAVNKRDKTAREIRRESDAELLDRLSPPDK